MGSITIHVPSSPDRQCQSLVTSVTSGAHDPQRALHDSCHKNRNARFLSPLIRFPSVYKKLEYHRQLRQEGGDHDLDTGTRRDVIYAKKSAPSPTKQQDVHSKLLILSFPFSLMFYDLRRAYRFAHSTRRLLIDKTASDGLTSEELKLLLAELSQSPPGIPGLARNSIAFMLMMILGVAIVHILVVDPPGSKDIPVSIDRILVLLTGLLTSVVSFYFGTRATETAQQQAAKDGASSASVKAQPITFTPKFWPSREAGHDLAERIRRREGDCPIRGGRRGHGHGKVGPIAK